MPVPERDVRLIQFCGHSKSAGLDCENRAIHPAKDFSGRVSDEKSLDPGPVHGSHYNSVDLSLPGKFRYSRASLPFQQVYLVF